MRSGKNQVMLKIKKKKEKKRGGGGEEVTMLLCDLGRIEYSTFFLNFCYFKTIFS